MKILIVEDNQLILKVIETKLKKEGYDVISCENGKEAMEKITDALPDLVITDIMLPYSSGLEIVNFVKVTLKQNIPVMVLSGMGQEKTNANQKIYKGFYCRIKIFLAISESLIY